MKTTATTLAVLGTAALAAAQSTTPAPTGCGRSPMCRKFSELYTGGQALCENMWGESIKYETNESLGLVMWFEGRDNPNIQVAARHPHLQHITAADEQNQCFLEYFHHNGPPVSNNNFNECRPWESSACCAPQTVRSANHLRESYGENWEWDRCGPLSPACERFFVKEACFYECDPVVGHWRRYPNADQVNSSAQDGLDRPPYDPECDFYSGVFNESKNCTGAGLNNWELLRAPIKASFCDDWYTACADDYFCATGGGDFFSCAAHYEACDQTFPPTQQTATQANSDDGVDTNVVIGVVVAVAVVAVAGLVMVVYMCNREKQGRPVFKPQVDINPTFVAEMPSEMEASTTDGARITKKSNV